jgi:SAM-dependent methyltransferase
MTTLQSLPVLVCTRCGQPLPTEAPAHCEGCGADYEVVDGNIVSFLPPGAGSALDDIDYDAVYKVDGGASDHLYRQCRKYLGDLVPQETTSYLEIGAGTGLFTLAFLSDAKPRHAMITDVSAKMLATCRQRLETRAVAAHTGLGFALWDGSTRCFRERAFDLVAGFSVLHHVLDYPRLLAILRDALSDDGLAVFLEPSLAFHRAMIGFMADVIQTMPANHPDWTGEDRGRIASWIGENYINTKFHGDPLALEMREDKHLFDGPGLRRAAEQAGFGGCRVIPFGDDNEAWTTLYVYMNQLPFSPATRKLLLARCARMMPGPFVYLAPEDRAPSFLIVLERTGTTAAAPSPAPEVPDVVFRHRDPQFRYSVELFLEADAETGQVRVTAAGWIFGDVDVREVAFGDDVRFPVGALRLDVEGLMNPDFAYPLQRALCCGIMQVRPQFIGSAAGEPIVVAGVTMAGERYELGRMDPQATYLQLEHLAGTTLTKVTAPA